MIMSAPSRVLCRPGSGTPLDLDLPPVVPPSCPGQSLLDAAGELDVVVLDEYRVVIVPSDEASHLPARLLVLEPPEPRCGLPVAATLAFGLIS